VVVSGPIVLRDGTEIPAFPLGIAARMVLYEAAIDASGEPGKAAVLVFACVGLQWEAACAVESSVPLKQRSVPAIPFRPWAKSGHDVYGYGAAVLEALQSEDIMSLRKLGTEILNGAWNSLQPPAEKIEEAAKNSQPEAGTSATSSGSVSAASETPSPS